VCVEISTTNGAGFFSVAHGDLDLVPCVKVKDSWQWPVVPEVDVAIQKYVVDFHAVFFNNDGKL